MRKLVNLFAVISLVTTTTSSVVACRRDTTESTKTQNEATVDDIVMKFNNFLKSQPHLECSESYNNLKDPQTVLALNQVLASNGLQLNGNPGKPSIAGEPYVASSGEWSDITYSGTWNKYETNMITVNIKVGSGDTAITKNVAGLKVQLATDQEAISDIINLLQEGIAKLTQPLILPNDVPNNASQAQAIINTELDTALKKEGIVLQGNPGGKGINPTGDWSHITYSGAIPQEGKPATNQISIIVNFGKDTQSLQNTNFKIKRAQTNKEQVEAIEGKIKNTDIIVPQGTNKDVTNKQTRAFLEGELKNLNPELEGDPGNGVQAPTGDFKKIFFTGGELEAGQPVTINIILISQDIPASKYGPSFSKIITNIQVTLAQSNQQIIDALTGEIINKTITLPYGKNYDPTNPDDKAIIFNNLKNANPLFQQALANLQNEVTTSLAGGMINMETTQATGLIFTLGYQDVTKDTNINIKINNTWDRVTSVDPSNSQPVQLGSTEYYATRKGLYYSLTQDGKTWTRVQQVGAFGTRFEPNVTKSPVKIGNYDYVTLQAHDTSNSYGLYRSLDNQNNWQPVTDISQSESFQAEPVRFNFGTPSQPKYKYFLMSQVDGGQFYTSTDGNRWTPIQGDIQHIGYAENAPSKIGNTLYVGTYTRGLWYSTDEGVTWKRYTIDQGGIPNNGWITYPPAQFGDGQSFVYVNGNNRTGVYYKDPNSNTWTKNPHGIDPDAVFQSKPVKIGDKIYWQSTNKGLWTSSNNGTTWTQSASEATLSGAGGQVNEVNQVYYLGTNKGFYTSTDGVNWTQNATSSLNNARVAPGKITKINNLYYVATTRGLWAKEY